MKYKINLYIGFSSIIIGILNCLKGIDEQLIVSQWNVILGVILVGAGMFNIGIFIGGNQ